ncbi:MAG: T9SS type A sorting domain-containing protein [Leptospiraceae bacterium]|nr:T9SS type A sorting domain-containing protein [Leptospiraceae bacterium]
MGAIHVYQPIIYEPIPGSGYGNYYPEVDSTINCITEEIDAIWYTFTTISDGILNFVITPDDPLDDYDWILFDLTNANCEDIYADTSLVVSCNAAAACSDQTGTSESSPYTNQGPNCDNFPPSQDLGFTQFNDVIPMMAGNTYALMVTNWSGSNNGFTIDFSTATGMGITDSIPPFIEALNVPNECQGNTIEIEFSEYIQCNTIDALNFQLSGPGEPYTLTLLSDVCDQGGNQDNLFTLSVSPFMVPGGNYTLDLIVDGSTEILDLNNNPIDATFFDFSTNNLLTNAPAVWSNQFEGNEIIVDEGQYVSLSLFSNNETPNPEFNFYSNSALTNLIFSGSNSYSFMATVSTSIFVTEFFGLCESPALEIPISLIEYPPQCPPTIEFIMVNGCAPFESDGEFMIIKSQEAIINIDDLTIDFYTNLDINGDIGSSEFCQFMPPPLIASLAGCPNVISVGPGDAIPPYSMVMIKTSFGGDASEYDWTPLCGEGQTIYLLQNNCDRTAGAFKDSNAPGEVRTTRILTPECMSELIYEPDLNSGVNGDFVMRCDTSETCPNGIIYGNDGCVAPSILNFVTHLNSMDANRENLSIFPNPASNEIRIEWEDEVQVLIVVSELNGSEITRTIGQGKQSTLSVSNLSPGVYFVKSFFDNGKTGVGMFVKY